MSEKTKILIKENRKNVILDDFLTKTTLTKSFNIDNRAIKNRQKSVDLTLARSTKLKNKN